MRSTGRPFRSSWPVTTRGRSVLALGVIVYLAAWTFGSKPLYPVATGLLIASAISWLWVRLAPRPIRIQRRTSERDFVEGHDIPVRLQVEPLRGWPVATG